MVYADGPAWPLRQKRRRITEMATYPRVLRCVLVQLRQMPYRLRSSKGEVVNWLSKARNRCLSARTGMGQTMKLRLIFALLLVPFPSFFKVWMYRIGFGYKIGKQVKIGFSAIIADECSIGDRSRIGHLNVFYRNQNLRIGSDVIIGFANRIFGGKLLDIGDKCHIHRFNEINSILDPLVLGDFDPTLELGEGSVITVNHKIDFTDRVTFGPSVVFAGRNSNIWTHNRQKTAPVSIGRNCYIGSNVQFVAGSSIGEYCVLALGSIVTKNIEGSWKIVAGMPAQVKKDLDEDSKVLVTYPTRPDLEGAEGALPVA